jgi:hypothetical protein
MKFLAKLAVALIVLVLAAALAILFLCSDVDAVATAAQEQEHKEEKKEDKKPLLKWVIIYEDRGWNGEQPYIELRILIKADGEGEAVAQSMKALIDKYGAQNCGHLKFKEIAQKKD